jgi:hypothetical protein
MFNVMANADMIPQLLMAGSDPIESRQACADVNKWVRRFAHATPRCRLRSPGLAEKTD